MFWKHEIRTNVVSKFWPFEQMTFWKYDFCSNFGNMSFGNLVFGNLTFGKKRSTVQSGSQISDFTLIFPAA
jgi:hypothetical protein